MKYRLEDPIFNKIILIKHMKLFISSKHAHLIFIKRSGYYLNAICPKETKNAILNIVRKHS